MSRHQVWLNGQALHSLHPAIRITDVLEPAPHQLLTTAARAAGNGVHILRQARQSLSVEVRFVIREYAPARRKAVLQAVQAWASPGGILTLGDRPGQQLCVIAQELPCLQSALAWADTLSLCFTACQSPYWEQALPTVFAPGPVVLPGNGPAAPVDLRWVSPGGQAAFLAETPLSRIHLNLPTARGQVLTITHRAGVPVITLDGQDVLFSRTPDSSDDLLLPCGVPGSISVTPGECTLEARGRWL